MEASAIPTAKATWADALLLALVLALMLWGLGSYGLYEPHEGHFAGVGREMVLRGDWITPHLNGAPYLNKPPLLYWMIATCYSLFGISEWAARLPLALIGFGGVALAWQWARQLWGLRAARIAAAMLPVSAGWYLFSHQLLIDLLLSVLYLASLYCLWLVSLRPQSGARWAAFYACAGLMIMSKGLIGLLYAAAAVVLFAVIRRGMDGSAQPGFFGAIKNTLRVSRPLMGALIVAVITLPWLALMESRNPGTLHYMIVNEHLKRVADTRWPPDYSVVKVSVAGFLIVAAVWMMPWSLLLPQVAAFAWKGGRRAAETSRPVSDAVLILAIGAILPVAIFLPMPSRLIYYCLPALAPFALIAAGWWATAEGNESLKSRHFAALVFLLGGATIFSAGFWVAGTIQKWPQLAAAPEVLAAIPTLAFVLGAALLLGGALLALGKLGWSAAALFAVLSAAQVYNLAGFASYDNVISSRRLVEHLRDKAGEDCVWVSEGSKEIGASAGIAFYLGVDRGGKPRSVYVMEDDSRRLPPGFPGAKAPYLINRAQLAEFWKSGHAVLFVTDSQRTDWEKDAPMLPEGELNPVPKCSAANRRVYANAAAWERLR